jgi:AraC-like DNA-binding protein
MKVHAGVAGFGLGMRSTIRLMVTVLAYLSGTHLMASDENTHGLQNISELRGYEINIADKGLWYLDEHSTFNPEAHELAQFKPMASLPKTIPRGASLWGAFKFVPGPRDSLELLFISPAFVDRFNLYINSQGQWQALKAGLTVPHKQLPLADNFMALPLKPSPHDHILYIQFENIHRSRLEIKEIFLLNHTEEHFWRTSFYDKLKTRDQFYFVFLALIFFILVIFMIQWLAQRNEALLFYCLYLLTCALYYLRIFEGVQHDFRPIFKHAGGFQYHLEIILAFCSYIFYLKFVSILLELPKYQPKLEWVINWVRHIFIVATPVLWLVGYAVDYVSMSDAYVYIRIIFFITGLYLIYSLWRYHSNYPLTKFITGGTLFLMLGMIMTLSPELLGGRLEKDIAGGAFGWYIANDQLISFPVYDFKTGVLLEIIIFSAGLGFRERLQRNEYLTAIEKLARAAAISKQQEPAPLYPFSLQSDFIKLAVQVCEANIADEDFNVEQLAQKLQISRRALYSKTNEYVAMDPSIFIRTIRLYQAKQALDKLDNISIAEIAYNVGFKHPYYFTKVFKLEFGCTPSEYLSKKNGTSPEY